MKFLLKNIVLFLSILIGFLFLSGAGIFPEFFIFTPSTELSKLVITISSLLAFVLLGRQIIKKLI
ncbi:hypothetical protein CIG19_10425 [Enterobacterales bacterium CwR94]|nr:hypothetical protein CIG19_10425 [Enterobacterales bacterium CwR94]